jgi:lysozyme
MINLLVIDLSHWDDVTDYAKVKASGIVGVIYKATQGSSYVDATYAPEREKAVGAGLLWGALHFGDGSSVTAQVKNFLSHAALNPQDLFALDYEDNTSQMNIQQAHDWMVAVEQELGRPTQGVLYSGNTIKETIRPQDQAFWAPRRLWLAQYASSPVVPPPWTSAWLWQYTDGGTVPGLAGQGTVDCNSYLGTAIQLANEWSTGQTTVQYCPCCHQPLPNQT